MEAIRAALTAKPILAISVKETLILSPSVPTSVAMRSKLKSKTVMLVPTQAASTAKSLLVTGALALMVLLHSASWFLAVATIKYKQEKNAIMEIVGVAQ